MSRPGLRSGHGTYSRTYVHKCMCEVCLAYRKARSRHIKQLSLVQQREGRIPHGTARGYDLGCRQDCCWEPKKEQRRISDARRDRRHEWAFQQALGLS